MTTEKTVELKVTVQVLNILLAALDEIPHKSARPVFDDLIAQAQPQLQAQAQQAEESDPKQTNRK